MKITIWKLTNNSERDINIYIHTLEVIYRYVDNQLHTCVIILHLHTQVNSCQTEKSEKKALSDKKINQNRVCLQK